MSSSTNYNSIINKSLNRQRLKPSKYLTHKIKELQKSETPVKKEEHKEVSKSPSTHPSTTPSVSQFKDNSSFVSTSQSINNLSPNQSFSATSKRMNSKSTNTLQSLLNQNFLTFSSSLSYKLNVDSNDKNKPQLDLFLNFPYQLENKCLSTTENIMNVKTENECSNKNVKEKNNKICCTLKVFIYIFLFFVILSFLLLFTGLALHFIYSS